MDTNDVGVIKHELKGVTLYGKQHKQEIVFKKDKATLHVISKRCEDTKHF